MCQISYSRRALLNFKLLLPSWTKIHSATGDEIWSSHYLTHTFILWPSLFLICLSVIPADALPKTSYREHFIQNDNICPNPLHPYEQFPKNTLVVSLPKKLPLFGPVNDFPCNFATTSDGDLKKVIVRAIHPSRFLWDYSGASNCDYFIKFKRSDVEGRRGKEENKNDVICRVLKQEDNSGEHKGSFFHPMMWNSPNHKMTLSFSTYNWDHQALENNSTATTSNKPVYLQMVFLVYTDNNKYCSLRVQQYLIDPLRAINTTCSWDFQHCGQYDCSEAKFLLESIGFRTYEVDEMAYARRKHNRTNHFPPGKKHSDKNNNVDWDSDSSEFGGNNNNNYINNNSHYYTSSTGGGIGSHEHLIPDRPSDFGVIEDGSVSKKHAFDPDSPTTTFTVTYYNNSNSVHNSFHSYAVSSILVVPLIVIIVAVLAIRCYISRSRGRGYRTYESRESLIVPLNRHPVIMNTHVSEDGNVLLGDRLPAHRFWPRDYSMDYIQPVDLRSLHRLSAAASKTTISAPPSYETLGPPRYSDAVII